MVGQNSPFFRSQNFPCNELIFYLFIERFSPIKMTFNGKWILSTPQFLVKYPFPKVVSTIYKEGENVIVAKKSDVWI